MEIPIVDLDGAFAITKSLQFALANNYIGEIPVRPTLMSLSILSTVGLHREPFTIYYYGTPDKYLKELFGYD